MSTNPVKYDPPKSLSGCVTHFWYISFLWNRGVLPPNASRMPNVSETLGYLNNLQNASAQYIAKGTSIRFHMRIQSIRDGIIYRQQDTPPAVTAAAVAAVAAAAVTTQQEGV